MFFGLSLFRSPGFFLSSRLGGQDSIYLFPDFFFPNKILELEFRSLNFPPTAKKKVSVPSTVPSSRSPLWWPETIKDQLFFLFELTDHPYFCFGVSDGSLLFLFLWVGPEDILAWIAALRFFVIGTSSVSQFIHC